MAAEQTPPVVNNHADRGHINMPGQKRDYRGNARRQYEPREKKDAPRPTVQNAYTPMFEHFRDELDQHHDRKERLVKASRDVTGLSKKIIFSLQRVRDIQKDLPEDISTDMQSRLDEIAGLLSPVAGDVQGINRWRYLRNMSCIEELVEALTFAHYLRTQTLMSYEEAVQWLADLSSRPPEVEDVPMEDDGGGDTKPDTDAKVKSIALTEDDYLGGVFDLSGEMMRFATTTAALNGKMASSASAPEDGGRERTIVTDMQDLGSFFEMLPQQKSKPYQNKLSVLRTSVLKVEKLGYGLTVRGSERPKGWMPDTDADPIPDED